MLNKFPDFTFKNEDATEFEVFFVAELPKLRAVCRFLEKHGNIV